MLWDLGQKAAAVQLMDHVVEVRKKSLDQDRPHRQSSETWLEYFHRDMGKGEEAPLGQPDETLMAQ
ncbi:uncharacterized protein A1O9_05446 [Exophiala aquamarina CBS 119918]|uniref:Uncharacterized protein n=1 Tax=Exophiala aquamarina CBS 119918 TaxID=1182545 RepID=A0A072PBP0_9EURO|nr:uncharacterized protein A1O9_05446 [Exophiala aquamarina CBS 119918]KEF57529.1 hypothetical protein A1O9_05446 [Exophiala aquamarina CBS 119918]